MLLAALAAIPFCRHPVARPAIYGSTFAACGLIMAAALPQLIAGGSGLGHDLSARHSVAPRPSPHRCSGRVLSRRGQSRRHGGQPVRHRLRSSRASPAAGAAVVPRLPRGDEPRRAGRRRVCVPVRLGADVARLVGAGDGASSRRGNSPCRLRLSGDGGLRHAVRCCCAFGLLAGTGRRLRVPEIRAAGRAATIGGRWCWRWRCSAPDRRPASCRCTSGCRSPIRRRPATSRR